VVKAVKGLKWGVVAAIGFLGCLGCGDAVNAGGGTAGAQVEGDPLDVVDDFEAGSLDDIHQTVFLRSCAGQKGLCHFGQFEPNLSTPAQAYANLVLRPSLERISDLRVAPGAPEKSVLIDKLRNKNVATQMPLGAAALAEEEIQLIEKWIAGGALRRPGAAPAPALNNPPREPEAGVFDSSGARLDLAGPATAPPGTVLTLRQTVQDFETADAEIPLALFVLQAADGRQVVLNPGAPDGQEVGTATFDANNAPQGSGDVFNWAYSFTVPSMVDLKGPTGIQTGVPTAGMKLSIVAGYVDGPPGGGGILTFTVLPDRIQVP
jgi:hypothetical protein